MGRLETVQKFSHGPAGPQIVNDQLDLCNRQGGQLDSARLGSGLGGTHPGTRQAAIRHGNVPGPRHADQQAAAGAVTGNICLVG